MDYIINSAKVLRAFALVVSLTLLLCGAVLLKAENTLAVQLLAGFALVLALPFFWMFTRLAGLIGGDRRSVQAFATGGKFGKGMAQIRWDLIDAYQLFLYGEFEEAGKKMRKVSKQAEAAAHDCWWLDSHAGDEA